MLPRWQGGVATVAVLVVALVLVALDVADRSVRHFWETHALTTDIVAGLLVLALTVLIVNQILSRRQLTDRSRAVAVQAGIVLVQARRSVKSVLATRANGLETRTRPGMSCVPTRSCCSLAHGPDRGPGCA